MNLEKIEAQIPDWVKDPWPKPPIEGEESEMYVIKINHDPQPWEDWFYIDSVYADYTSMRRRLIKNWAWNPECYQQVVTSSLFGDLRRLHEN